MAYYSPYHRKADLDFNWRSRTGPEGDEQMVKVAQEQFRRGADLAHFWTSEDTPPEEEIKFSRFSFNKLRALASGPACGSLYKENLQARLYVWMKRNKGLLKEEPRPLSLVCSSSLEWILTTPIRRRNWSFLAVRVNDLIFLHQDHYEGETEGGASSENFKRIAIGQDPITHESNQFQEPMTIRKVSFGQHQLLFPTSSSSIYHYESGKKVTVRLEASYLDSWASVVVAGHRSVYDGRSGVDRLPVNDVVDKSRCIQFLQDVLDQVASELPSNDPAIVKKFQWNSVAEKVGRWLRCEQLVDAKLQEAREKLRLDWLKKNVFNDWDTKKGNWLDDASNFPSL